MKESERASPFLGSHPDFTARFTERGDKKSTVPNHGSARLLGMAKLVGEGGKGEGGGVLGKILSPHVVLCIHVLTNASS